jgi:hypothetical protein
VRLASSIGLLRFDGPVPVSLALMSVELMVVLNQHKVELGGVRGSTQRGIRDCATYDGDWPCVGDFLWR